MPRLVGVEAGLEVLLLGRTYQGQDAVAAGLVGEIVEEGEEVAAAVVLREGHTLDEPTLRDFCGQRLAQFKVPRKIVFLAEIPKGATGKLQRIGLAEKLGLSA